MKLLQVLTLFFITGLSLPLQAQTVYNNDCLNVFLAGRFVCGNAAFAQDNLHGRGINDFGSQFQNNPGCISSSGSGGFPEHQSAWYAIRIQAGGTLTMDIIPTNNASYNFDFAIFGPNKPCHALGVPIRCSNATPRFPNWYKTGMSMSESRVSEDDGGFGYVRYMDVLPGQTYYILINSFNSFNSGFSLTWGGTAKLAVSYADFKHTVSCNVATFSNSSTVCDGSLGYEWDFGDGSPITGENYERNPRHHYAAIGTYQAKLRITVVSSSSPTNVGIKDSLTLPVVITKVPPAVQSLSIKTAYCADEPAVPLSATPAGGIFSLKKNQQGSYTDLTTLDPAALGVGRHELRYVVQDPTDLACKSYKVWLIEVFPAVTAQFTNLPASLCLNASPLTLTGTPTGGTFTLDGQPATILNPALLSIGTLYLHSSARRV